MIRGYKAFFSISGLLSDVEKDCQIYKDGNCSAFSANHEQQNISQRTILLRVGVFMLVLAIFLCGIIIRLAWPLPKSSNVIDFHLLSDNSTYYMAAQTSLSNTEIVSQTVSGNTSYYETSSIMTIII